MNVTKCFSNYILDNSHDGSIEKIKKELDDDMGSIRNALEKYSKAKSEMRIYINCNENPDIRETLFKTYKTIITHMFMTKFVLSDLEVERKSIYKRAALCDSRDGKNLSIHIFKPINPG